jgi:hypothetical protein
MLGSGNTDMYIEISAYQLLYDWGENKQRKLVEYANISINQELRRQIKQTISITITQSYLNVLKQSNKIEIYTTAIARQKDQLKVSENLHSIGRVTNLDLQKTKISIAIKERELSLAKAVYAQMLSDLKHLSFIESDAPIAIEDNIEFLYSENQWLPKQEQIMQNHPSLKSFDEMITQQKLQQPQLIGRVHISLSVKTLTTILVWVFATRCLSVAGEVIKMELFVVRCEYLNSKSNKIKRSPTFKKKSHPPPYC